MKEEAIWHLVAKNIWPIMTSHLISTPSCVVSLHFYHFSQVPYLRTYIELMLTAIISEWFSKAPQFSCHFDLVPGRVVSSFEIILIGNRMKPELQKKYV